jgi:2-amino-4-hydroxy-6-hydroxymethyldihydropteridine diphosphokinase
MNVTYLCLGGNIGDREKSIDLALLKISEQVGEISLKSEIYETEAWGVINQQAYLNQCIEVKTNLTSLELINILLFIEKDLGRERTLNIIYESRTIDIDILFFNNDIINQSQLIVPHPRLHLRNFVLIPLHEIAANYLHPVLNKTIFNLLSDCNDISEVIHFKTIN